MNISVIILFSIGKELRRPINNLIVALAMADLLINLIGTPFSGIASFFKEWMFGDTFCHVYGFVMSFWGYVVECLVTVIAVERSIVIVTPQRNVTLL